MTTTYYNLFSRLMGADADHDPVLHYKNGHNRLVVCLTEASIHEIEQEIAQDRHTYCEEVRADRDRLAREVDRLIKGTPLEPGDIDMPDTMESLRARIKVLTWQRDKERETVQRYRERFETLLKEVDSLKQKTDTQRRAINTLVGRIDIISEAVAGRIGKNAIDGFDGGGERG